MLQLGQSKLHKTLSPFAALILILAALLLIKMALYYTLLIVISNKMAVKLDSLSCSRADVISQSEPKVKN